MQPKHAPNKVSGLKPGTEASQVAHSWGRLQTGCFGNIGSDGERARLSSSEILALLTAKLSVPWILTELGGFRL